MSVPENVEKSFQSFPAFDAPRGPLKWEVERRLSGDSTMPVQRLLRVGGGWPDVNTQGLLPLHFGLSQQQWREP